MSATIAIICLIFMGAINVALLYIILIQASPEHDEERREEDAMQEKYLKEYMQKMEAKGHARKIRRRFQSGKICTGIPDQEGPDESEGHGGAEKEDPA